MSRPLFSPKPILPLLSLCLTAAFIKLLNAQSHLPPDLLQPSPLNHPNFLACHAHDDWRNFLNAIQKAHESGEMGTYNEDLVFEAQRLLFEYEGQYLMAQNSKRMFVECAWETRDWEKAVEDVQIGTWLRREVGELEKRGVVGVGNGIGGGMRTGEGEDEAPTRLSLEDSIQELLLARTESMSNSDAQQKFSIYSEHYPKFLKHERNFLNNQLFLNHSDIHGLYLQNVKQRVREENNEHPPFCMWGYYIAALIRSRAQLGDLGPDGVDKDRLVVVHMLQRMLMERANMADVGDLSGWPIDHLTMIRFLWPSEDWRVSQPGGAPSDVSDSFRPLVRAGSSSGSAMEGGGRGGDVLFQVPEHYPLIAHGGISIGGGQAREMRISILGYHTTLALEPAKVLELLPQTFNPRLRLRIRIEVVEDGLEVDGQKEMDELEKQMNFGQSGKRDGGSGGGESGSGSGESAISSSLSEGMLDEDDDGNSSTTSSTEKFQEDNADTPKSADKNSEDPNNPDTSPSKPPFSLCKNFDVCATDTRLLYLNRKYLRRVRLPKTDISNPQFPKFNEWVAEFVEMFKNTGASETENAVEDFSTLDQADIFFCTEPAVLCLPMALAFPTKLMIGYFGNPLAAYVPSEHVQSWLENFRDLPNLFPVTNTRFLAKQMEYQTGRYVNTVRPLALYVTEDGVSGGANWTPPTLGREVENVNLYPGDGGEFGGYHDDWGRQTVQKQEGGKSEGDYQQQKSTLRSLSPDNYLHRPGPLAQTYLRQILVLREVSVFWDITCMLNLFSKLNNVKTRFHYSDSLKDKSYTAFGKFDAVVIFPYDASQMRFYEFYAMNMPIILPRKMVLASYVFRGMTSIEDFDHRIQSLQDGDGNATDVPNPFSQWNYDIASYWSLYSHYFLLPHLLYFRSSAHLFELLGETPADELIALSGKMKKKNAVDLALALKFWGEALNVQGIR